MSTAQTPTLRAADAALSALGPRPFALPLGPLAPAVAGAFSAMSRGDWAFVGPRGRIGASLRGASPERLIDPAAGARPYKLAPVSDAPGSRALHAVGAALASKRPTLCLLGPASVASGAFHEALNVGALTGAPAVFVLLLQEITDDAPVGRQLAADPMALASAHGWHTQSANPTEEDVHAAVSAARATGGPALVCVRIPHT